MTHSTAHLDALRKHGDACHTRADTIDSQHRAFQAEIAPLAAAWLGDGGKSNMALLPMLEELHKSVSNGFRLCGDKVHGAHGGYQTGDAHQDQTVSKVVSQAGSITTSLT
jgi:uncharacterized protein YukE